MKTLSDWLMGDLTPLARIFTALAPALLPLAWFAVGLLLYVLRLRRHGPYREPDIEAKQAGPLFGLELRRAFAWSLQPLWRLVHASGLPPAALTTLSLFLAVGSGVAVAAGRFALGGWLFIAAGLFDVLDGRLARATNSASRRGAALDSILDRLADAALLVGLAWYYRGTWVLLACLLALVASSVVSYIRARGEGLGVSVRSGWFARPERVLILGLSVALSPAVAAFRAPSAAHPMHWLAVCGIVIVALGATTTMVHRFVRLLHLLDATPPRPAPVSLARGSTVRAAICAALATAVDALSVVGLVSWLGLPPWLATVLGCVVGAVVNFASSRLWAFESSGEGDRPQAKKYGVVWTSSALLNGGGVALLLLAGIDYRLAWLLVRLVVFVGWNYPLHRDYVFAAVERPEHAR